MTPMTKSLALTLRSLLPLAAGAAIAVATLYPLAANQHSAATVQSATSSAADARGAFAKPYVVPDLAERVARFKLVHMPFNSAGLSAREKQMAAKLVDASGLLDCIYWRQNDPAGLRLYLSLEKSTGMRGSESPSPLRSPIDIEILRYLKINGSRFDLIDDDKPFVGTQPMPPGRGFYPPDMTKQKFDTYVAAHPDQKTALYSPFTVVRTKPKSTPDSELIAIPYHVEYREFVEAMAQDLREAATLSDDPAFAKFLRLRAAALLTDDYYASDIAWLDLENPKFDVVFAPYEVYDDSLLGVKTTYGASLMIRNDAESEKLALYQKYVPDWQEALPLPAADLPSKRGKQSPMEVVDSPYRAGDLLHGYQAVADNLPNDPRIHEEKGSKKVFWKNFMDARVDYVILPLAKRVLRPDQAKLVTGEGTLDFIILHEISHGLGPAYARMASGKVDVREAIGPQYSGLEESKADVTGMRCVAWLADHGVIPKSKLPEIYASFPCDQFRTIRF